MFHALGALLLVLVTNAAAWLGGQLLPTNLRVPLDGGALLADRRRVLGDHKTWAGLIMGALACGAAAMLLRRPFQLGASFGVLSLAGDGASSFIKRRFGLPPGAEVPALDHLPEALVPLLVLARPLGLSWLEAIAVAAAFAILNLAFVECRHLAAKLSGRT